MSPARESKPARLNIRVSEHEKVVLARAARASGTTVSQFVLQKAYAEAQAVLAEQTRFGLPPRQWHKFCAALDAPPKDVSALRKLLTEPGRFDG
jgi:uncharacterized protein (DUF1778 family)